jgi:hypothetical protein
VGDAPSQDGSVDRRRGAALIISAVAAAQAQRPDAGDIAADEEAFRRKNAREQNAHRFSGDLRRAFGPSQLHPARGAEGPEIEGRRG